MAIIAVQYLERPYPEATPAVACKRLHEAFSRLPISHVLLGWELPPSLEEAVAKEVSLHNGKLFRWQPILTGDAHTLIPLEWQTIGYEGNCISGYAGLPEFTFICPNQSAVRDFLFERIDNVASSGIYQGIFLDRIRFPSPSINPINELACFCKHCKRVAADAGLELESVSSYIQILPPERIVQSLLGNTDLANSPLEAFLDFRADSITRVVCSIAKQASSSHLSIGLDCFSPSLTRMVGQELRALNKVADWIKIMTYPRVFGPAGISYELLHFCEWLILHGLAEIDAIEIIARASRLPIPSDLKEIRSSGIDSEAISQELNSGYAQGATNLLAGIALVHLDKIHSSTAHQLYSDLENSLKSDGIVISWDLWLTPLNFLEIIRNLWS
jgi:hypothetical protein